MSVCLTKIVVRIRGISIQGHIVGKGTIIANRPNAVRVATEHVRGGAEIIAVGAPRRPRA